MHSRNYTLLWIVLLEITAFAPWHIISNMMKRLSADAGLSMLYTNYCIRATSITNMKQCCFGNRRICTASGRRNVRLLSGYDRPTTKDACAMAATATIDLKSASSAGVLAVPADRILFCRMQSLSYYWYGLQVPSPIHASSKVPLLRSHCTSMLLQPPSRILQ